MPIYFFCTFDFKTIAWIFCLSLLEISVLHESFASPVFSFIVSSRQPSIQLFGKLHRKIYYDHTFGPERGSIKPNLFQNQNNVIQTSIFFSDETHFLVFSISFSELKPGIFLWTQSTTAGQKTQTPRTQRHSTLVKVRTAI